MRKEGTQQNLQNPRSRQSLRLLIRILLVSILHGGFEILDAFAQALAQIGQLAGAKDQQRNRQDEQNFRQTQFARHDFYLQRDSPGALVSAIVTRAIPLWKF